MTRVGRKRPSSDRVSESETHAVQFSSSTKDVIAAEDALESTLQNIEIPESILRRNPTVDPIKQNTLYRNIKQNPEIWIIGANRHEYSYDKFKSVTKQLNSIFKFVNDEDVGIQTKNKETDNWAIGPVIYGGNEWLNGNSYNAIINGRQNFYEDEDIDTAIKKSLETVKTDIRFVLVKYYGILTTLLEHIDTEVPDWMSRS
ncbi:hypothetical protein EL22_28845 [Halostagnicola sp. A56]|nr:hypothetical protein EL22_28845 [Halostagnicola sp. A56]